MFAFRIIGLVPNDVFKITCIITCLYQRMPTLLPARDSEGMFVRMGHKRHNFSLVGLTKCARVSCHELLVFYFTSVFKCLRISLELPDCEYSLPHVTGSLSLTWIFSYPSWILCAIQDCWGLLMIYLKNRWISKCDEFVCRLLADTSQSIYKWFNLLW